MLAYVFWHWPWPDVAASEYEQLQRVFHAALATAAPSGLARSSVFRVSGTAQWLAGSPAYADWYLLNNSGAIDALNVAAVSGVCEAPHTAVARAMAAGAGSLFGLRTGEADLAVACHLSFLTKPRTVPYSSFDAQFGATPGADQTSLWRRALVLGPTPEFAVLSSVELVFSPELQPVHLALTPL